MTYLLLTEDDNDNNIVIYIYKPLKNKGVTSCYHLPGVDKAVLYTKLNSLVQNYKRPECDMVDAHELTA